MSRTRTTTVIATGAIVVVLAGLIVGGRAIWDRINATGSTDACQVAAYTLVPDQAVVASQMVGVVLRRNLPERAAVLTLAAGLQESKLSNIPSGQGDRDSVGVLQQRPSQGWGTVAQLSDVRYATGAFLDRLVQVDGWQTRPLTQVVQAVQVSAYPDAYAQHEPEAQVLADALSGRTPRSLSCSYAKPDQVASTGTISAEVLRDLPVERPTTAAATVSVPGAGWATASYFVANGDRLGLAEVAYAGQRWTRNAGWGADADAAAGSVVATIQS